MTDNYYDSDTSSTTDIQGYNSFKSGAEELLKSTSDDDEHRKAAAEFFLTSAQFFPAECDIYRALSCCLSEKETSSQENMEYIQRMYSTRNTFGNLVTNTNSLVKIEHGGYPLQYYIDQGEIPKEFIIHQFIAKYPIPLFDIPMLISDKSDISLAIASLYLRTNLSPEHFDSVKKIIDEVPNSHTYKGIILAFLYRKAERWHDVISTLENSPAPYSRDAYGIKSDTLDEGANRVKFFLRGEALAHLGKFDAALRNLRASSDEFAAEIVSAFSYHIQGRLFLSKSDREAAKDSFSEQTARASNKRFSDVGIVLSETPLDITSEEMINNRTSYWDKNSEPKLRDYQEDERKKKQKEYFAESKKELDKQIGMSDVKQQIERMIASIQMEMEMQKRGLSGSGLNSQSSNHLILTGPPGTGKTTIVRILTYAWAGLGMIREPKIIEGSREIMVGEHEGESASKTKSLCEEASGGVLFIDEAYTLIQERNNGTDPFGGEALNTLMKIMEDKRGDFIVVFAGYEDKIDRLLKFNEGLPGRFTKKIKFTNYSPRELGEILLYFAEQKNKLVDPSIIDFFETERGFLLSPNAEGKLHIDILANGRFARKILETAIASLPERYMREFMTTGKSFSDLTDEELKTVTLSDLKRAYVEIIHQDLRVYKKELLDD